MREVGDWEEYTHVPDALRASCCEAAVEEPQATIIAEAVVGLLYH
jgi:hypothetical protein